MGKEDNFDASSSTTSTGLFDATAISPIFPVTDMDTAVAHYRQLGFETEFYGGGEYAFIRAGRAELHLSTVRHLDPATNTSACYLYVEDADELYNRWNDDDEIKGRFTPPVDTEYGLREFAHIDVDGNLIRVGSSLA